MSANRFSAAITGLVLAAGLVSCSSPGPDDALDRFLQAWQAGRLADAPYQGRAGTEVAQTYQQVAGDLAGRPPRLRAGRIDDGDGRATAAVDVTWPVADGVEWRYATRVELVHSDDRWRIDWTAATVHPRLATGLRLRLEHDQPDRAPILDGSGQPIFAQRPVVHVGVEPRRVQDAVKLAQNLATILGVDTRTLPERIANAASPQAFVEVITLRREQYEPLADKLHALPGTVFREGTLPLAPTREFARALLGTVGPVTEEVMDRSPGRYFVGDQVGLSGLQKRFEQRLAGTPEVDVVASGPDLQQHAEVLFRGSARPGNPARITLDQRIQRAADAALAAERRRSALVAVRVSDGAILAVANGPGGGTTNLSFEGRTAPGSTFKMVTALALLEKGLRADSPVPCPASSTVDGTTIRNVDGRGLGTVPFSVAFAASCNTTFAELAGRLDEDSLTRTAKNLGIGATWQLGVEVFAGSVPAPDTAAKRAATAFGQGDTTVSPLALAGAAAAVAAGRWRQPTLLVDPATPAAPAGPELPGTAVAALRDMMRAVITSGTGKALDGLPGPPVHGKTGTAEHEPQSPPHAWFTGWQGDIAFAVFVEGGVGGATTAVPIAGRFLRTLQPR